MHNFSKVYNKHSNIVSKKVEEGHLIIPIVNNVADMEQIYTLDETASVIWEKIDGSNNVSAIIESLMNDFDVEKNTLESDVTDFINILLEKNFIEEKICKR